MFENKDYLINNLNNLYFSLNRLRFRIYKVIINKRGKINMNQSLLEQLKIITAEEQAILNNKVNIQKSIYTGNDQFIVESKKMLDKQTLISVRTHTRFADFPLHRHNYIEMMYVCQGSITHIIDNKKVVLRQGEILLLNQHSWHEIKKASADDIAINLMILPEFFDMVYTMIGYNNIIGDFLINILKQDECRGEYLLFKVADILQIQNLMENIIYSLLQSESEFRHEHQITMGLLFLYLTKYIARTKKGTTKEFEELLVETVVDYITDNYKHATLNEIAQILNQPVYALSKLIKQQTQRNFKELLQSRKFYRAEELLRDTKLSINDIITAVGYENNSYFFKRFKAKYKMTPTAYRNKMKL